MDFRTEELFGSNTQTLVDRTRRELYANNKVQVTAYIRLKHELLTYCNAFDRSKRLSQPGERHAFAERLDKDILQASITAEKDISKFDEPAWSVDLARAREVVSILTKQLTALKTGLDHQSIIQQSASE